MLGNRVTQTTTDTGGGSTTDPPPVDPEVPVDTNVYQLVDPANTVTQTNVVCTNLTTTNQTFSGITKNAADTIRINASTGNVSCNGIQATTIINDDFLYLKDNALYSISASATQVSSSTLASATVSSTGAHSSNIAFEIPAGQPAVQPGFEARVFMLGPDDGLPSVDVYTADGGLNYDMDFYLPEAIQPTFQIGTTTTLDAGEPATVTLTGGPTTDYLYTFDLAIPQGDRGARGPGGSDGSKGDKGDKVGGLIYLYH